jgi:hypothetical protein
MGLLTRNQYFLTFVLQLVGLELMLIAINTHAIISPTILGHAAITIVTWVGVMVARMAGVVMAMWAVMAGWVVMMVAQMAMMAGVVMAWWW